MKSIKESSASSLATLADFLRDRLPVCVLTGAGCSTASGIFDYRDTAGAWKRPQPVLLDDFLNSAQARRRYWARSMLGWPRFAAAKPNDAHTAIAALERAGIVSAVVTQNVDDLHEEAGSVNVVALHGSLSTVTCLACQQTLPRADIQERLEATNPRFVRAAVTPDAGGEGHYAIEVDATFEVPNCEHCEGVLKPDVVFFGGNVAPDVKEAANMAVSAARGLLVAGSSLMVYSSFRLVKLARERGMPIAIVGFGKTRGDSLASLRLEREVTATFAEIQRLKRV